EWLIEELALLDAAMQSNQKSAGALVKSARVLVVDDEYYTRKVIRTLLSSVGVTEIYEAVDGASGLDSVRELGPDIVILDRGMAGEYYGPDPIRLASYKPEADGYGLPAQQVADPPKSDMILVD